MLGLRMGNWSNTRSDISQNCSLYHQFYPYFENVRSEHYHISDFCVSHLRHIDDIHTLYHQCVSLVQKRKQRH